MRDHAIEMVHKEPELVRVRNNGDCADSFQRVEITDQTA